MSFGDGNLRARVGELERENAELRALARDMGESLIHGNCYRWCDLPCDGKCHFAKRMKELGVWK